MALMSKARQILMNEARKIRTKIDGKKSEIRKLEAELIDLDAQIKKL